MPERSEARVSQGGEGRLVRMTPEQQRAHLVAMLRGGTGDIATQKGWDLAVEEMTPRYVALLDLERRILDATEPVATLLNPLDLPRDAYGKILAAVESSVREGLSVAARGGTEGPVTPRDLEPRIVDATESVAAFLDPLGLPRETYMLVLAKVETAVREGLTVTDGGVTEDDSSPTRVAASLSDEALLREHGYRVAPWDQPRGTWVLKAPDGEMLQVGSYGGVSPTRWEAVAEGVRRIRQDEHLAKGSACQAQGQGGTEDERPTLEQHAAVIEALADANTREGELLRAARIVYGSIMPDTRSGRPTISHEAAEALGSALAARAASTQQTGEEVGPGVLESTSVGEPAAGRAASTGDDAP